MNIFFPIRWRLTIWYSAIVLLSLSIFAFTAYYWVFNELYSNLDESLIKISKTLNHIIKESSDESDDKQTFLDALSRSDDRFKLFRQEEQLRFVGPRKPGTEVKTGDKQDVVWSAIFKHILLNPNNYYIQIADTNRQIIWKSKNLDVYELPLNLDYKQIDKVVNIGSYQMAFDNVKIDEVPLRLLINNSGQAVITIAYTVEEVRQTLKALFTFFLFSVPLILLVSFSGGMFLSKISLKPVDRIINTTKEITARNLKLKMSVPPTNDEISRLTETINDMINRLDKSFTQIKQFTSDASHELRTPLTILRGELEIALKKDRTNEEYAEILTSLLEEVFRMSRVVESLLELSRADAGQTKMQLFMGNFSALVADLTEDVEILADDKEIKVYSEINSDIYFKFDELRMHQAILNILDNAIKYSEVGDSITVQLSENNSYVELKVMDTGIGMTDEELSYIFDRFYRVDKARSGHIKGTGLGLSIVKWIIEAHNGKIFIESQPKRGTNFTVMLPKDANKIEIEK